MTRNNYWETQFLDKWLEQAKDYPTKALLYTAISVVFPLQAERIDALEGQIDGVAWSPEDWND